MKKSVRYVIAIFVSMMVFLPTTKALKINDFNKSITDNIIILANDPNNPDGSTDSTSEGPTLCDIIKTEHNGDSLADLIKEIIGIMEVAGIVLFVVMSMVEFTKCLISQDENAMKKAQSNLFKRIIALVALLLASSIVQLVLNVADIDGINKVDPLCEIDSEGGDN